MSNTDLYLDPTTNDYTFENGVPKLVSNTLDSARQRMLVRYRTWLGEWFMNTTNFGLPYRQQILKKNVRKDTIDALIIAETNKIDEVESIVEFSSEIDSVNRIYKCTIRVKVIPDEIVNVQAQRNKEWCYPTPSDDNVPSGGDSTDYITLANELYALVNFDLPIDGSSTWYNLWVN